MRNFESEGGALFSISLTIMYFVSYFYSVLLLSVDVLIICNVVL